MLNYLTKNLSWLLNKALFLTLLLFFIINPLFAENKIEDIGNSFFKNNDKTTVKAENQDKTQIKNKKNISDSKKTIDNTSSETDIGNSFFKNQTKNLDALNSKPINQVGPAFESRQNLSAAYVFINQLLTNQIFYELRAYGAYNYVFKNAPSNIPNSNQNPPLGYGGALLLGYNFAISTNLSFLPFIRLQALKNMVEAYRDTFGNKVDSINYAALLGGKLSRRVTDNFAVYAQYSAGFQLSKLSGSGIFTSTDNPTINIIQSVIEFGGPFKIIKTLNLTPYIQYITLIPHPNHAARAAPYSLGQLTNVSSLFGIKLGIVF